MLNFGGVLGIVRILIIIKSNCWKSATVASIEISLPGSDSDERIGGTKACDDPRDRAGQIIETSHNLISKGSWGREITFFQANLGWWNSLIWPDRVFFCSSLNCLALICSKLSSFFWLATWALLHEREWNIHPRNFIYTQCNHVLNGLPSFFQAILISWLLVSKFKISRFNTADGWNPANQLRLVVMPLFSGCF